MQSNEQKFTEGPWVWEARDGNHPLNTNGGWGVEGLFKVDGEQILGTGPGWERPYVTPNDADARLIAACPDMLEASNAALQCITDLIECIKRGASDIVINEALGSCKNDALPLLKKAIAKATVNVSEGVTND